MIRKYIPIILLAVAVLAAGCHKEPEHAAVERPGVSGVSLMTVNAAPAEDYYEATGTVTTHTTSMISSRVMGTVTSVKVREGDRVKKGAVLLTIDDRDIKAKVSAAKQAHNEAMRALKSAEEQKALAEKTFLRYKKLHEEKALSTQELDNVESQMKVAGFELERARARVNQAEAGLREAEVFLGFTKVISPLDGVVAEKRIDPGSMASPGMPLMLVQDDSSYRVEVNVDERYLEDIHTGTEAKVFLSLIGDWVEGTVSEVVPKVQPETRTFLVKVDITHPSLRSGQYGKVRFVIGRKPALLVPSSAVVRKGQLTGVYAVNEEGIITYRLIRVGRGYDENIEVISGLNAGDRIIVSGLEHARDGGILKEKAEK